MRSVQGEHTINQAGELGQSAWPWTGHEFDSALRPLSPERFQDREGEEKVSQGSSAKHKESVHRFIL